MLAVLGFPIAASSSAGETARACAYQQADSPMPDCSRGCCGAPTGHAEEDDELVFDLGIDRPLELAGCS